MIIIIIFRVRASGPHEVHTPCPVETPVSRFPRWFFVTNFPGVCLVWSIPILRSVWSRLWSVLFAYSIFKNIEILSDQKFYRISDCQYYLGFNAKRMVRLTFLEKSSYFNRKYRHIRLFYFQNIEILLDQGVVQSEPN